MITVKADDKYRLTIPRELRQSLGVSPGDTFAVAYDAEHGVLRFAKAENPFDVLARHAIAEHRAGRTRDLREIAAEYGVDLDAE
ncbi:MAG: AbrB/MazE/SpoVT family DNA-binding domain-containing protein [Thermomicrobiales bacterium]